jgi:hypothetical protein
VWRVAIGCALSLRGLRKLLPSVYVLDSISPMPGSFERTLLRTNRIRCAGVEEPRAATRRTS